MENNKNKERKLLLNRWKTPDGTILTSYHRHDFVSHLDANGDTYFVDGGSDYIRLSVNAIPMEDMCVYTDSDYELIRSTICRGTFDETGLMIWIPLKDMTDEHLRNCIEYNRERKPEGEEDDEHTKLYVRELEYRGLKL